MSTKIERRGREPKEGMREDGDVEFADPTKEDRAAEQHASADAHNPATAGVSSARSWSHHSLARIVRLSRAVRVLCAHSVTRSLTG